MSEKIFFKKIEAENNGEKRAWLKTPEFERAERDYKNIIEARNKLYEKLAEENTDRMLSKKALDRHNNVVLHYACDLAKNMAGDEKKAAIIGSLIHDADKLDADLLEHHSKDPERTRGILEKSGKQSDKVIRMALQGVERHMNHPYLIGMLNKKIKGELEKAGDEKEKENIIKRYEEKQGIEIYRYEEKGKENTLFMFPTPKSEVDKVVFSADMLANIGFKNIPFRFLVKKDVEDDRKEAKERKCPLLKVMAEKVVKDAYSMKENIENKEATMNKKMLTEKARGMLEGHAKDVKSIFEKLEANDAFGLVQRELGKENLSAGDMEVAVRRLNEEIEKAGLALGIGKIDLQHYQM